MNTNLIPKPRIYVAGHRGMVGPAIVRRLLSAEHSLSHIITCAHTELDQTERAAVRHFFVVEKPDQLYLAGAKVSGSDFLKNHTQRNAQTA